MSRELTVKQDNGYLSAMEMMESEANSGGDRDILKLNKDDGFWSFGQEGAEVDEEQDVFVVDVTSLRKGYVCFTKKFELAETVDGEPADFLYPLHLCPRADDFEDEHELAQPKRGETLVWKVQFAVNLLCVEGPNKGAELIYKPSSVGGKKFIGKLAGEIARKMKSSEAFVPAINLFAEPYQSANFGRIFNPKYAIVSWQTEDATELAAPEDEGEDDTKSRKPAKRGKPAQTEAKPAANKRTRRTAEPEPEDEDEDEVEEAEERKPARRTRGSADSVRGKRKAVKDEEAEDEVEEDEGEEEAEERTPRRSNRERNAWAKTRSRRAEKPAEDEEAEEEEEVRGGPRGRGRRRAR